MIARCVEDHVCFASSILAIEVGIYLRGPMSGIYLLPVCIVSGQIDSRVE
jgi:hypothetical protein